MKYSVAFFSKHFCERGTEKTTYDYADFNEKILGNKSFIICFKEKIIKKNKYIASKDFIKKKYFERFEVFEIETIFEIKQILESNNITHFYTQSHGFYRDIFKFDNFKIWNNCRTIYHCAFGPMARQGSSQRCIVGSYLNKRFLKNLPVLPPIVRKHKFTGNLRAELNIPKDSIVIGRHGGKDTFDINFVKRAISNYINTKKDIYFLFLNTEKFINHERVIFLENFTDAQVLKFISTCDAMIHARYHGETFGLAIAEFSAANKPVITFKKSKDKEHLKILKYKAITYSNKDELNRIFESLPDIINTQNQWNAYKAFEPSNVMKLFNDICLENRKKTFLNKATTLLRDLPWEIKISIDKVLNIQKKAFLRLIPYKIKEKVKPLIGIFKK